MSLKYLSPNIGCGPLFYLIDIGLKDKVCLVESQTCFWSIVNTKDLTEEIKILTEEFEKHKSEMEKELNLLRFGLKPSAVYFNPTERCNLNCSYCYIPESLRKNGKTMSKRDIYRYLDRLYDYFYSYTNIYPSLKPQIIFHGSEPTIVKDKIFEAMDDFKEKFVFGLQTNGTLLSQEDISYLKQNGISVGISLDGAIENIANLTRKDWAGEGHFKKVLKVIESLADYKKLNIMLTITKLNLHHLKEFVIFFHQLGIDSIMLNPVRCTQKGGIELKPEDEKLLHFFIDALEESFNLYEKTGRKIIISNFANILSGILGPTTRKLMCDISPCGAGRCFFALGAKGDLYPCSEFIGMSEFNGGNINSESINSILNTKPFKTVTSRKIEDFHPCSTCSIKHFCGAPCPAEVYNLYKDLSHPSPYCLFYQGVVKYGFKILALEREQAFLWDFWEDEVDLVYKLEN